MKHISQASVSSAVLMKWVGSSCCWSSLLILFQSQFLCEWGALVLQFSSMCAICMTMKTNTAYYLSGNNEIFFFKKRSYVLVVNSILSGKRSSLRAPQENEQHVHTSQALSEFWFWPPTYTTPRKDPWPSIFHLSKAILAHLEWSRFHTPQQRSFQSSVRLVIFTQLPLFKHHRLWFNSPLTAYVMFKTDVLLMRLCALPCSDYKNTGGNCLSKVGC